MMKTALNVLDHPLMSFPKIFSHVSSLLDHIFEATIFNNLFIIFQNNKDKEVQYCCILLVLSIFSPCWRLFAINIFCPVWNASARILIYLRLVIVNVTIQTRHLLRFLSN